MPSLAPCLRVALFATLLSCTLLPASADVVKTAGADQLTQDAAAVGVAVNAAALPVDPVGSGRWTSLISWPHIPVSIANLPDGRLLTWAGDGRLTWDGGDSRRTYAAVWDPRTGQFTEINNQRHDMFCGGLTSMTDGRVLVNGGDACNAIATIFDGRTNQWVALPSMNDGRWYNPSVSLPDGGVFTATGSGTGINTAERWDAATGWRRLPGIPWQNVLLDAGMQNNWHPFLVLAPSGKLYHFGPTKTAHWIDPSGSGSLTNSGQVLPGVYYPKEGAYAMYEEGKILIAGGYANNSGRSTATQTNQAMVVDVNLAAPTFTPVASMRFPRFFANSVVLPNGEVLVIGGNTSGVQFSDADAVLTPEIWNPRTNTWRVVANVAVVRAYHSTAILLPDGRVFSGGGGLNGGDHPDAQVFTPPALLNADGTAAVRPVISSGASTIGYGQTFEIKATPGIAQFAMIRLSALTHSVNTDLRRLVVPATETAAGTYQLTSHANRNVMTPGYWMLFAIDPQGVYSEARTLFVSTASTPSLTAPDEQQTPVNQAVDLTVNGFVPAGTPVYSATGLPPGLQINASTGRITGTVTTQGGYRPTVSVTAAGQTASVTFGWTVLLPNLGTGTILREVWTGIGGNPLVNLTSNLAYPGRPTSTGTLTSFNAPQDTADNYGQRVRGYLHAPVTGTYRFYIAADDSGQLLLSTDASPARATTIATVPGATAPQAWNVYPEQTSVSINLEAGKRYYIEALAKEGVGGDHLSVAWTLPGSTAISIIPGSYLSPYQIPQTVTREVYTGITGVTIAELTRSPSFPAQPNSTGTLAHFEAPTDVLDNYGQRLRSWVTAPVTGQYRFYIASDDNGQLSLSTDANPANARVIATVPVYTASRSWTVYAQQASALITLQAGQRYYIEALMKEGGGGDNLAVGWTIPGTSGIQLLTSEYLSLTPPPTINSPGNLSHAVGESVSVALQASASTAGGALSFTATGLPPGLSIAPNAAVITGQPTQSGTYAVSVTVTEAGGLSAAVSFSWTIRDALTLPPLSGTPLVSGTAVTLNIAGTGGTNPRYTWNFGDGTPDSAYSSSGSVTHTFPGPGRYIITVTAQDDTGRIVTSSFWQVIHAPLTATRPTASSALAYAPAATGNARLWVTNPDSDSVAILDAVTGAKLNEISISGSPRCVAIAPNGRVWITAAQGDALYIVNPAANNAVQTIALPRGSRPFGLAFQPDGAAAWLTLEATGQLLKLDPATAAILRTTDVGANPRHLSITADSSRVLVSRFITPPLPGESTAVIDTTGRGGEVVVVAATDGAIVKTATLQHSEAPESQASARGIPNYLAAPVISPDGLSAWIPSKQDNIKRGQLREASDLTHDGTVRAIASKLSLASFTEEYSERVDFDNSGVPSASAFDPYGGYLFVALEANRQVAIVDVWNAAVVAHFPVGRAPQAIALSPDGRTLYVQNFMDRTVSVLDVSIFQQGRVAAPGVIATTGTAAAEKLAAQVLRGKQLFYDAADNRLALEGYISCAACHNDGGHDGRTWDFTGFGEGLRNTPTLRGHAKTGPSHWTGNFDEIQDFENQIRNFARGSGLIENGTPNPPLGASNAGRSADLDALAAYVNSLTTHGTSPAAPDSAAALAGGAVFMQQNCLSCHSGRSLTNSALGVFADIGTIKPSTGKRLGAALPGLDVPTLRGLWGTAPYLHDGSAATLEDAISAHRGVNLSATDRTNLAAFLRTLDDTARTPGEFTDPGFETPSLGNGFAYNPAGSSWTFSASSGLSGNGSGFTNQNPAAPEGTQVLFLQATGLAEQSVLLRPGTYRLRFSAAQRSTYNTGPQTVVVTAGGTEIARLVPASSNYARLETGVFTAGATPIAIRFAGTGRRADGTVLADTTAFIDDLQIVAVNNVPIVTAPAAQSTARGLAVNLPVTATDADGGQTLTYSATGLPAGLTIDAATGVISGTVAGNAAASNNVTITVNDGIASATASFVWTITPGRVASFADDFSGAALDDTRWSPGSLNVVFAGALDLGVTIAQTGGKLVITPRTNTDGYNYNGILSNGTVDLRGSAVTAEVVPAANSSLTWFAAGRDRDFALIAVTADTIYMEQTTDGVEDFTTLPYNATTQRYWRIRHDSGSDQLVFEASGDGLAWTVLRVTPRQIALDALQIECVAGTYQAEAAPGSASFDNILYTPNRRPELAAVSTQITQAGRTASLQLSASDADGQTLAFTATGLPAGLTLNATTGLISGTVALDALASNAVTATVSDGLLSRSVSFLWNVLPASALPAGWASVAVGGGTIPGDANFTNGVYTLSSAGAGVVNGNDQFQYAWQQFVGDGEFIARIPAQTAADPGSRAGLIFRETLQGNSRFVAVYLTPGKGFVFEIRTATGALTRVTLAARFTAPNNWVRLTRSGDTFAGYRSTNGTTWTQIANATIAMTRSLTAGLVVSSNVSGVTSTASFDNVSLKPTTLPAPWNGGDIGAPPLTELERFASGVFTVSGGGTGYTGNVDQGHFTSQTLTGNGEIIARVKSQSVANPWAKAGVMIRDTADPRSRFALVSVTEKNDIYYQTRASVGATAVTTAAPRGDTWLRLVRAGSKITAYRSANGTSWTQIGTTTMNFNATVSIGLAITGSTGTVLSTASFDNVSVSQLP